MTLPATDPALLDVLEELKAREPIFHREELGVTREALEAQTAAAFWQVGATGLAYDRQHVIDTVETRFLEGTEPDTSRWASSDHWCRELGPDTYLLTYILDQAGRRSRRATIWRRSADGWQIVYHQGTLIRGRRRSARQPCGI
ncbi:MAG: hypothetical protein KC492_22970, partial [Myxococcales bacterium]|nr:hypothetical protein [Myxococcales bacterium]